MSGSQSNSVVTDTAMQDALQSVLRELLAPAAKMETLRRKELLTGQEVEELYGLSYGTLRNWRTKGLGPKATRIGQLVFYRHQDLQNYIAAHQVKTYDQQ